MENVWDATKLMFIVYGMAAVVSFLVAWVIKLTFAAIRMHGARAQRRSNRRRSQDREPEHAGNRRPAPVSGVATLVAAGPTIAIARIVLMVLGMLFVYLGAKGTLEPLIMIPMGFGMSAVNAGVLYLAATTTGTIFLDPMTSETGQLVNILQIDFLQPIYTFMFSNGLIACLVFMGIGVISDIGYVLISPFRSMFLARVCRTGHGADLSDRGRVRHPLQGSRGDRNDRWRRRPDGALYLAHPGQGHLRADHDRGLSVPEPDLRCLPVHDQAADTQGAAGNQDGYPQQSENQQGREDDLRCHHQYSALPAVPGGAPLFMSFFLGIVIRESGVTQFVDFIGGPVLYGSTFFLGLLLGVLCEAGTILNPKVLTLLVLGMLSLLISGIGGIIGGYILYWTSGRTFNPVIGIAGVSCVPTTAKVAQKEARDANKLVQILPWAMGASICGVISSAIHRRDLRDFAAVIPDVARAHGATSSVDKLIRTVVFDFEGTLVDFQWRLEAAQTELRRAFAEQGYVVEGNYAEMWNAAADLAAPQGRLEALRRALFPIYDRWDTEALTRWSPRSGASALLQRLADRNVKSAMVSQCRACRARRRTRAFRPSSQAVAGAQSRRRDTPQAHPEGVSVVLAAMKARRKRRCSSATAWLTSAPRAPSGCAWRSFRAASHRGPPSPPRRPTGWSRGSTTLPT